MKKRYGLKLREEIHANDMLTHPGKDVAQIAKHDRLAIIRSFADELAAMSDISIINVLNDKSNKTPGYNVFEMTWTALLQRFENTIRHRNFPGPSNSDERGVIFPDNTDNKKVVRIMRKLRKYNPIPNQMQYGAGYRNLQFRYIIEDANFRDSRISYFVQAADLSAFLLYQMLRPNRYVKSKHAHKYFNRLNPVLCKVASSGDPNGIVRL